MQRWAAKMIPAMEKLSHEERITGPNLKIFKHEEWGDPFEVFKVLKEMDGLLLDYMLQVRNEEKNRFKSHLHMLAIPKARVDMRRYSINMEPLTESVIHFKKQDRWTF